MRTTRSAFEFPSSENSVGPLARRSVGRGGVLAGLGLALGDQSIELGLGHGDGAVGLLCLELGWFVVPLLELLLGLTQRASQLGELGTAEDEQHDQQDDDQFGGSDAGHIAPKAAADATISRSSDDVNANGTA